MRNHLIIESVVYKLKRGSLKITIFMTGINESIVTKNVYRITRNRLIVTITNKEK